MSSDAPLAAKIFDKLTGGAALPTPLPPDAFPMFQSWFEEAGRAKHQPNPSAFSLATVDPDGRPSNRIVLCRGIDAAAGTIRFFTNYKGRKGRAIAANPRVAACFHWDHLDKQVRMEGIAIKTTPEESDEYFASRPWDNRVGSWASDQSEPITDRSQLFAKAMEVLKRHGVGVTDIALKGNNIHIPRPPHWGGFRIWVDRLEIWLGSSARFHDRAVWTRSLTLSQPPSEAVPRPTVQASPWVSTRLQP